MKDRWQIRTRCRDCGAEWECTHPDFSVETIRSERVRGPGRLVLIGVPDVCPECRNLKVAK